MSQTPQSALGYLKEFLCCCKAGYEELHGIERQAKQNYDEVKSNLNTCTQDWPTLHTETKTKLEEVVIEYSPYIDEEVTDRQRIARVINRSKELSTYFEQLRQSHYALGSKVKVNRGQAKALHKFFQTRLSRINEHGMNAAIATGILGAIIGAIVAWNIYKTIVPTVLGALIGLTAAILIAAVIFFMFWRVAKNAVERWGSLKANAAGMKSLNGVIKQKAKELNSIPDILNSMEDDIKCASETLVKQANIYLTEK